MAKPKTLVDKLKFWRKEADEVSSPPALPSRMTTIPNVLAHNGATAGATTMILGARGAPSRRSADQLDKAYRTSPWIHAAVRAIAFSIAEIKWRAFDKDGEAISTGHPLIDFLERGNGFLSGMLCMMVSQIYVELRGEVCWLLERDGRGNPISYYPMPPRWVQEWPSNGKPFYVFALPTGEQIKASAEDVVWFKIPDPENPYGRGVGTAESLADELDVDELAAKMIKARFLNNGTPSLLIKIEGATDEVAEQVKARFDSENRGPFRAGGTMVVNSGIEIAQLSQSFAELQLSDLRSWERDTIISVYGVPPEIIGILGNSNRATITEAFRIFAMRVQRPRLVLWANFLNVILKPLFGNGRADVTIGFELPSVSDPTAQEAARTAAPWALTRGEWRQAMGLQDRGDVDNVHYVAFGFALLRPEETQALPMVAEGDVTEIDDSDPAERVVPQALVARGAQHRAFTKTEIKILLNALPGEALNKRMKPIVQVTGSKNAVKIVDKMGVSFGEVADEVKGAVGTILKKGLRDVNATTKAQLKKTLQDGILEGESVAELKRRVREVFEGASSSRAETIARTEAMKAANGAKLTAIETAAAKGLAEGLEKEWIAQLDGATRESHRLLDGARVKADEPFVFSTGGRTSAPGQSGIADEDVNCRCTVGVIFAERGVPEGVAREGEGVEDVTSSLPSTAFDARRSAWGEFDRELRESEESLVKAVRRGFRDQEEAVLRIFDRLAGE